MERKRITVEKEEEEEEEFVRRMEASTKPSVLLVKIYGNEAHKNNHTKKSWVCSFAFAEAIGGFFVVVVFHDTHDYYYNHVVHIVHRRLARHVISSGNTTKTLSFWGKGIGHKRRTPTIWSFTPIR